MHVGYEACRWSKLGTAAVLLALALVAANRPAHAQGCTKDVDCKGLRVCENGRCVEPPPAAAEAPPAAAPPPCHKDTDCEGDLVCENGVCGVAGAAADDQGAAAAEPQQAEPELAAAETEPPEPVYEEPPQQPDPAQVWVQGFWDWFNDQWQWRSGAWRTPPAGTAYVQPHYEIVRGKVAYNRPHWGSPKVKQRSYGGKVLKFRPAVRPAGYVKGMKPVVKPNPGLKVGKRPAVGYKWAGKPTHKFVVPPPKPAVAPVRGVPPRVTPAVGPGVRPGPVVHRPPTPATPPVTRTPPRPLGLDSKQGTRCR